MKSYKVSVARFGHVAGGRIQVEMTVVDSTHPGRKTPLPDHIIRNYMYQLCKSLQHMHRW